MAQLLQELVSMSATILSFSSSPAIVSFSTCPVTCLYFCYSIIQINFLYYYNWPDYLQALVCTSAALLSFSSSPSTIFIPKCVQTLNYNMSASILACSSPPATLPDTTTSGLLVCKPATVLTCSSTHPTTSDPTVSRQLSLCLIQFYFGNPLRHEKHLSLTPSSTSLNTYSCFLLTNAAI